MDYKIEIAKRLNEITNIDVNELENFLEIPPDKKLGDFAFPCFRLAKELKKAPPIIAQELKEKLTEDEVIERVDVVGGYLNIFVNKKGFVESTIKEAIETIKIVLITKPKTPYCPLINSIPNKKEPKSPFSPFS